MTDDRLTAIREYITGWEPTRDRRFLEAARALLDHSDALAAENARLREALRSIEHDARLSANPARAHSGQVSYDELLAGYAEIADAARALLEGGA
jgi:hypothetical protein